MNFALDPWRIPRTCGQVFLLQLPAEPALDARKAQEFFDAPTARHASPRKKVPRVGGDRQLPVWRDGRPEFVVNAWPARRLPAAVVACVIVPGHDCRRPSLSNHGPSQDECRVMPPGRLGQSQRWPFVAGRPQLSQSGGGEPLPLEVLFWVANSSSTAS